MLKEYITQIQFLSDKLEKNHRFLDDSLKKMCKIVEFDHQMAATRARICCEYIIRDIFRQEINEPQRKSLHELITELERQSKLPSHIKVAVKFIQGLGNITSHPDPISLEEINEPFVTNAFHLTQILLKWYLEKNSKSSEADYTTFPPSDVFLEKVDKRFWQVYREYFQIWKNYISWGTAGFSVRAIVSGKEQRIIDIYPREGIAFIREQDLKKLGDFNNSYSEYRKSMQHITGIQNVIERKRRYISHDLLEEKDIKDIFAATDTFIKAISSLS